MSAAPQIRTALTENLKALHLPAMRDCFEQAAQQAEKETLSYEQYLLGLSERECESRRCNRIAALLGYWGATEQKTRLRIQATSTIESDGLRSARRPTDAKLTGYDF
jgi:hypothetical protein